MHAFFHKKSSKAMIIYSYNTYILPCKDLLTNTCEKLPIRKEIFLKWLIFESSEQLPRSNYMCGYHWLVIFMPTGYDCILEREYVHIWPLFFIKNSFILVI